MLCACMEGGFSQIWSHILVTVAFCITVASRGGGTGAADLATAGPIIYGETDHTEEQKLSKSLKNF